MSETNSSNNNNIQAKYRKPRRGEKSAEGVGDTSTGTGTNMGTDAIIQRTPNRPSNHSPTDRQRTPVRNTGSGTGTDTETPNDLSPKTAEKTQRNKEIEVDELESIGGMKGTEETEEVGQKVMDEMGVDVNACDDYTETEEIYCRSKKGGFTIALTGCGTECLFNVGNEFRTVFLNSSMEKGLYVWIMQIKCDKDGRGLDIGGAPLNSPRNFADNYLSGKGACSFCFSLGRDGCVWIGVNGVNGKARPRNSQIAPGDEKIIVEIVANATAHTLSLRMRQRILFVITEVKWPFRLGVTGSGEASFNSLTFRRIDETSLSNEGCLFYTCCSK